VFKRSSSRVVGKFVSLLLVSAVVTTGCTLRPKHEQSEAAGSQPSTNSLATPVNPPFPGPYKTVEVNGVEFKQGRFPQGKYGGTLIFPLIASDPKTFNPWVSNDSMSGQLGGLMFSGLLAQDLYTGKMEPDLASEYKVDPDHLTYTVKLRKGLKWSDGKPITADDVEYTFNTIVGQGYGNTSMRDVLTVDGKMPKVTVVDPLTVKFVTAKPFAPFLRTLGLPIAPKHVIEPVLKQKDGRSRFDRFWSQSDSTTPNTLVTSGPFVLKRFVPSQRVELVRTNNFYMIDPAGKRLPYLDRLTYLFVPDVNTTMLKFEGGETDISGLRNRDAVRLQSQQKAGNFTLYNLGPMTSSNFLMFNENRRKNPKGQPYVEPYKSAWFNDLNFRQAINHAINRDNIINGYLKGIGAQSWASVPKISPYLDADLKPINTDVAAAKDLLAKSGFTMGKDGWLHDKDGHRVEFTMLGYAGSTFHEAMGTSITNDLKNIGIKVNFQPIETNVLFDKVNGSKEWEAVIMGLTDDPFDPHGGSNVYRSDGRLHLWDIRDSRPDGTIVVTDARPWEKDLDKIFQAGAQEFDETKRKQIYDQFQQIMYDQVPFVYLVTPMTIIGARNTLQNYQPTQLSQNIDGLHNLEEIWKENKK
jgi:peptide/nickel transport system substrate-binding protein